MRWQSMIYDQAWSGKYIVYNIQANVFSVVEGAAYYMSIICSIALKDLKNCLPNVSASTDVIALLFFLHALRGQDDEDRVLVQKVADENAAEFIVIALFLLRPTFTFGLVQLHHDL